MTEREGGSGGQTEGTITDGERPRLWNCFGDLCPGNSQIEKKEEKIKIIIALRQNKARGEALDAMTSHKKWAQPWLARDYRNAYRCSMI